MASSRLSWDIQLYSNIMMREKMTPLAVMGLFTTYDKTLTEKEREFVKRPYGNM